MAAYKEGMDIGEVDAGGIKLPKRYVYDDIPLLKLSPSRLAARELVSSRVATGEYQFEAVDCCTCNGCDFELLATKDRYGLFMPVVICRRCGLVQTNPRMDQRSYDEFYSSGYRNLYSGPQPKAEFFDAQYSRGKVIHEFLASSGFEVTGMFVLEVGCGAGGIIKYFKDLGNTVLGIDLDEEYLDFGRMEHGLDLRCGKLGDVCIERVPDLVIYSHVVEHLLDPVKELQLLGEVISTNTIVYIEVPGIRNIKRNYYMDFLRYLQNAHAYHYTLTTLTNLLMKNGFAVLKGDEFIRVIAGKEPGRNSIEPRNDYGDTMGFLLRAERLRRFFLAHRFRRIARRNIPVVLKKVKLYPVAYQLYRRLNRQKY